MCNQNNIGNRFVVFTTHLATADEGLLAGPALVGVAKGERVADEPPDDATKASVKNVLQQDVLGVLGTDGTGLEQREAALQNVKGVADVRK